ncbi:hypothetical protein BDQ12DRAFT_736307 [Crucibulum laeve]|uniref:Oxidoreductase AflY n=1 Tax=Crucibulum laeve TaxID=68775 RepID=A0A5C3LYK1_9AGAR|nr:hypothetical protein BDQ12DRAFT_736307 [Crucibulum laeve]
MSTKEASTLTLNELFPSPTPSTAPGSPRFWPGLTPTSVEELKTNLKDNHERWHIFFNDMRFHNHSAHSALALWALGADESILQASYKDSSAYQRPAFEAPNAITATNWKDHLGDEKYYQGYLKFFNEEIKTHGGDEVLKKYVFTNEANIAAGGGPNPSMLQRFLAGLLHPLIHTGYGLEFNLPGMLVEGLAQTAVHEVQTENLLPASVFKSNDGVENLTSRLLRGVGLKNTPAEHKDGVHALTVLARVFADDRLGKNLTEDIRKNFSDTVLNGGHIIKEYTDQWTFHGKLEDLVEELVWANVVIYAIGGWEGAGKPLNADFFYMHLVTSSLFLSSLVHRISSTDAERLLRGYFAISLAVYISQGKPTLDIAGFYEDTTVHPTPPGPLPTPSEGTHPSPSSPIAVTPNPWFAILQTTIVHRDDHLPKLQRALSHYAELYGGRISGSFANTELKGAEHLDGTLFVRAAILTTNRMGWVREGEPPLHFWDRRGFFKSSAESKA